MRELKKEHMELVLYGKPKVVGNFFTEMARSRISNLGYNFKAEEADGFFTLRISQPGAVAKKEIPWLNIVLFIFTNVFPYKNLKLFLSSFTCFGNAMA